MMRAGRRQPTYQAAGVEQIVIYQAVCRICGWEADQAHPLDTPAWDEALAHRCRFVTE